MNGRPGDRRLSSSIEVSPVIAAKMISLSVRALTRQIAFDSSLFLEDRQQQRRVDDSLQ